MRRENKRRDGVEREWVEKIRRGEAVQHPDVGKSLEETQDYHIGFRYIL